ncbi:MAG: hypothetical protein WBF58_17725 [Xanthobacteraceae bacterium]
MNIPSGMANDRERSSKCKFLLRLPDIALAVIIIGSIGAVIYTYTVLHLYGLAIVELFPLYLILQIWLGYAWAGRWRIAALVPLIGFILLLVGAAVEYSRGANLWPLPVIFFAPLGLVYFLIVGTARALTHRRLGRRYASSARD